MILASTDKIKKIFREKIGLKKYFSFIYLAQKKKNIYENGMELGVLKYAKSNGMVYFIEKIDNNDVI